MKLVLVGLGLFMVFMLGCSDDSGEPTPTSTVSAPAGSPTSTAPGSSPTVVAGECPLPTPHCGQAEEIRAWLASADVDSVVGATRTRTYTCTGGSGAGAPMPLCDGAPNGEQRMGVGVARRYSEGAALSVDDYRAALQAFLDAVNPTASDAGGSGALDLVAVSCVDPSQAPDQCTRSVAIFSAIVRQTTIPGWGIPGGREVLLFWMTADSVDTDTPIEETWTGIVQPDEVPVIMSSGGTLFDLGQVFTVN